jgi:hypothetical protein
LLDAISKHLVQYSHPLPNLPLHSFVPFIIIIAQSFVLGMILASVGRFPLSCCFVWPVWHAYMRISFPFLVLLCSARWCGQLLFNIINPSISRRCFPSSDRGWLFIVLCTMLFVIVGRQVHRLALSACYSIAMCCYRSPFLCFVSALVCFFARG